MRVKIINLNLALRWEWYIPVTRPKPGLCLLPPRASRNDWRRVEPDANHDGSLEGAANTDLAEVSAQEYHSFFTDCLHQNAGFFRPALPAREGFSRPALSGRQGISIPALADRTGMYYWSYTGTGPRFL